MNLAIIDCLCGLEFGWKRTCFFASFRAGGGTLLERLLAPLPRDSAVAEKFPRSLSTEVRYCGGAAVCEPSLNRCWPAPKTFACLWSTVRKSPGTVTRRLREIRPPPASKWSFPPLPNAPPAAFPLLWDRSGGRKPAAPLGGPSGLRKWIKDSCLPRRAKGKHKPP